MNTATRAWAEAFTRLVEAQARDGSSLTEAEARAIRRLPIAEIVEYPEVFQPRNLEDEQTAAESKRHVTELKQALENAGNLEPIVVWRCGTEWVCIDGHHRLEAYRQAGGKRTHVPVRIFQGTTDEAYRCAIEANTPDKLNMAKADKYEAAWRLVLRGTGSARKAARAAGVAKDTTDRMTKAKQTIEQDHPTALPCTWKHARWLLSGKESRNGWQEEKVKELRRMFGKGLSGHTAKYPDLIARALVEHDRALAQAIAEAVQQRCNMGETEPDF